MALLIGFLSGLVAVLFLSSINWAISFRRQYDWIIFFLPLIGFLIAYFYKHFSNGVELGSNLILDEVHESREKIPLRIVPFIFLGTVSSHLFGASVGREGAAVQMGAGISDQIYRWFGKFIDNRKIIIMMGMSAGFASVFGTPMAGAIFGIEVLFIGLLTYEALLPCMISAVIGFYTTMILGITHPHYLSFESPNITIHGIISSIIAGVFFGYTAKFFVWAIHKIKNLFVEKVSNQLYAPVIGGIVLIALYYLVGSDRYHSLGEDVIRSSFNQRVYPWDFLVKIFSTVLSVGSGFRGGEVMSLFYIGSTLGNSLSFILPLDYSILAAMGFVAVFAGAANTPLTCLVMTFELFGPGLGIYAGLAIVTSYLFSGKSGIYQSQRAHTEKVI